MQAYLKHRQGKLTHFLDSMRTRRIYIKIVFLFALAAVLQSVRNIWDVAKQSDTSTTTKWQIGNSEIKTPSYLQDLDAIETVFVVVVSMQRSSSTFLSHQILTGANHSKQESPINNAPPMSTCPLRHFITLNEVFTNHPQQSGDAWEVEGKDLVRDGTDPKDLTVEQLSDFLQQVAQRRCREKVQEDLKLVSSVNFSTQNDLLSTCPPRLRHHQCSVSYKHFDFHLPHEKVEKIWKTLVPNLRVVILERKIEERWRSVWVAKQTGDWNVHGTEDHKKKLAELEKKVPIVPDRFRSEHETWFSVVRSALKPGHLLEGVPQLDLAFYDVVGKPLEVRNQTLELIWNRKGNPGVESKQMKGNDYDPSQHSTGAFANCVPEDTSALIQDSSDTVTVACKTFRYKLVQESFQRAGPLLVGVLSTATGAERRKVGIWQMKRRRPRLTI